MRKAHRPFIVGTLTAVVVLGTVVFAQKQATIFVTVVAPSSGPLAGLKAADFSAVGGKLEVKDAIRATEPLSIELIVDISRPPLNINPPIEDVRTALKAFVQTIRTAEPGARIGLMQVANAAVPTVALGAPAAALDKATGMVAPGPDMGGAVIVEAIQAASHTLADEPAPRRAMVTIDFASSDPFPDVQAGAVVKDVFKSGASLWAISVRTPTQEPNTGRENVINSIAKNNGGLRITIVDPAGLKDQLQLVANSLLSQYELTIAGVDAAHAHDLKLSTTAGAKVVPSVFAR